MSELKPCPFCGGEATVTSNTEQEAFIGCHNYKLCRVCPKIATSCYPPTFDKGVIEWNTRITKP